MHNIFNTTMKKNKKFIKYFQLNSVQTWFSNLKCFILRIVNVWWTKIATLPDIYKITIVFLLDCLNVLVNYFFIVFERMFCSWYSENTDNIYICGEVAKTLIETSSQWKKTKSKWNVLIKSKILSEIEYVKFDSCNYKKNVSVIFVSLNEC